MYYVSNYDRIEARNIAAWQTAFRYAKQWAKETGQTHFVGKWDGAHGRLMAGFNADGRRILNRRIR